MMNNRPLVSTGWLAEHLEDDTVRIVDASWHLPATGRHASAEFEKAHVPGAVFFDIDEHSAPGHLPHMMPTATVFANAAGRLGLSDKHQIVVYDSVGLFSAARVWWMFRYFGARNVYVLDGGLPAWLDAGLAVESGSADPVPVNFDIHDSAYAIATSEDVRRASVSGDSLILDARSQARYRAIEKEVREGLRSGHVPGSKSMPFTDLLNNGYLKSDEELQVLLQERGVGKQSSVITTCGSGVTAAVISLALECIGVSDVALYDGSWTEWGALPDMPVATG